MTTATFVDIILAILLPPLGVFLRFGCEVLNSFIFLYFISFLFFFFFFFFFFSYSFFMWLIINSGRVLDLFVADPFWLSPWDTLCYLCYNQVNFNLCKRPFTSLSFSPLLLFYFYISYNHFFNAKLNSFLTENGKIFLKEGFIKIKIILSIK